MRKIYLFIGIMLFGVLLVSCNSDITIDITDTSITVEQGETYQIDADASQGDLTFESQDTSIVSINESGLVEALKEGTTKIVITSKEDDSVEVIVDVTVILSNYVKTNDESLVVVQDHMIALDYQASGDVNLTSSDSSIFIIEDGKVKGVSEGSATLTISLVSDASIKVEITINVTKNVILTIDEPLNEMFVDQQKTLTFTANDDVTFESSDTEVISIDENGLMIAHQLGTATISVVSTYDNAIKTSVTFNVLDDPNEITISGLSSVMMDETTMLNIDVDPENSYKGVIWSSSDETIATIDANGNLSAKTPGVVIITATSIYDDDIKATFELEVLNAVVVKADAVEGDTYTYQGYDYVYGEKLFTSIDEAMLNIDAYTQILLTDDVYEDDILINVDGTSIKGINDATIDAVITVDADDVSLSKLTFSNEARIINTNAINNFTFTYNTVTALQGSNIVFLQMDDINQLMISHNDFNNYVGQSIVLTNVLQSETVISHNTFNQVSSALSIDNTTETVEDALLFIERNTISQVDTVMAIFDNKDVSTNTYIRFNDISNYTGVAIESNTGNHIDATLNYWGENGPLNDKFLNIEETQLLGYYDDPNDIVKEEDFDPEIPLVIIPDMDTIDMVLGDEAQITFSVLPTTASTSRIKFITSDSDTLRINTNGELNPLTSGQATITLRLSSDFSINAQVVVNITTTPGIELSTNNTSSGIVVGDLVLLEATPFPLDISEYEVAFTSSDDQIATIDASGVIEAKQAGVVTLTATLVEMPDITQTFTIEVFDSLDDNNLLDLLTQYQVNYATPHEWISYGTSYNYYDFKYESVSKYYFGDIEINQSKLLNVSEGIRPGEPFDDLPDGVTQYNPYNLYWIVVHDTANTSTGAGALSHANYLWNLASSGSTPYVSWHFTIDDQELYQHLPETERGYHAGDGSSQVLQGSTYLGGGNRNGIGIEMGVNDDADVYRTWQRTAKFVASLLTKYDLPRENMKYHNDFSGKDCPKTLRNAGLIPLFEEFEDIEYKVANEFSDATITFESHNPEYVDDTGRVIAMPDRAMTVSYTITVTQDGITSSRTFNTYLPGTIH